MNSKTIRFPISSQDKIQLLFNWKMFYQMKSCKEYPAILCFPDFFTNSIFSILKWYSHESNADLPHFFQYPLLLEIKNQIRRFFEMLEVLVNVIINDRNYKVRVKDPRKIEKQLREIVLMSKNNNNNSSQDIEKNKKTEIEHFFLEWYLENETSQNNYQHILFKRNLELNKVNTLEELSRNLYDTGCCNTIEDVLLSPPHSIHYVNQTVVSNCSLLPPELYGPAGWGPIYWNIFHAFPINAKNNNDSEINCLPEHLYAFINILPLLIPCFICTKHYYDIIQPSEIKPIFSIPEYENLYEKIHKKVSNDK